MENRLTNYLNVVTAFNSSAIPGKQKFTFLSKKTGIPQAYLWNGSNEDIKPYGEFEDRVMSVFHAPSGKNSIIGMDYQGNEKQQFYLVDEEGNYRDLVVAPEYFHNFGGWSTDESKIIYSSNRRNAGCFDIFMLDIATGEEKAVYEYDGNCVPICWITNSENEIIVSIQETNIDNSLYLLTIDSGERRKIGPNDISARYKSVVLSKDERTAFLLSDFENDTMGIYKCKLDEPGTLEELVHEPKWDIEEISLNPNQQTIVYSVNIGGTTVLKMYDLAEKTTSEIKNVPKGVISSISWLDANRFVFSIKSPLLPGDVFVYDMDNSEAVRATYFGVSETIEHLWTEPQLCTFQSFDGLEVPYFYYSREEKPKAAVVYVHGGPESQIKQDFNPVIQYLVSEGFAVVAPNVRGSMGYGRKYLQMDDRRKRMDSVADLASLVEDLVKNRGVNKDNIGIIGRSYGGFMVLAAVTHYPELWAAGVNIVGISHFKSFLENTGPWRRRLRECEYGYLGEDDDFFEEIAPMNHLSKIKAPLLVFHGRNDTRVPVSEAEQLTKEMLDMDKEVELFIFEDEGHQTDKLSNHITLNTKVVEFFNKHLLVAHC
ncbi:S9 family peptidase [Sporosarcina highlanderae]|uniref:Alpha/beta fold hydrolase n=1 Tax=Sporosarcina highlanderae TaxID=3035916 RepID=A0ABT8JSM6_9BACL|nr:alpha/beta fold hydrolase [Sporosarcina highlanderae]MDN4608115.1 alpha/beta fold hydrolase [Sporosarcina highlanderae]